MTAFAWNKSKEFGRVVVMHLDTIKSILEEDNYGSRDEDERAAVAGIISVEPYSTRPGEEYAFWRLSQDTEGSIPRHYTTFCYSDPVWSDLRTEHWKDNPEVRKIVAGRLTALHETLDFANDILGKTPANTKIIVHDYCAEKFAAAVTLAVICDQFPHDTDKKLIEAIKKNSLVTPDFLDREIAVIDAAMGRQGKLVDAWEENSPRFSNRDGRFNINRAHRLQKLVENVIEDGHPHFPRQRQSAPASPQAAC